MFVKHKITASTCGGRRGGRDPARYAQGCFQLYYVLSLKENPLRMKAVEYEWARMDSKHRPYHPRRGHGM